MGAGGTPVAAATRQPAARPGKLSQRASLNSLAAAVDYGARFVVELLVTPLLVSALGTYLYGAWRVLWQWAGYTWAASGRSSQALQSAVAHHQSSTDTEVKRQYVASALLVWALFLPLLCAVGGIGVWLAPYLLKTPTNQMGAVRLAASILVVDAIALALLTIPRAVLQGENLGYKRMGWSAAVLGVGGVATVVAAQAGLGLPGVAAAALMTTVLTGLLFLQVARRQVPWFGLSRPTRATLRWFLGLSSWFLVWKLVFELMTASDVLILAALASVQLVTSYVLTKFVADVLSAMMLALVQGVIPGLGGVIGSGDRERAAHLRAELMALTWLVVTVAGATMLVWNASFVRLWVGGERFAGPVVTLLIVVLVVQFVFIRNDNYVIDVTLRLPDKVRLGAVATAVSIAVAVVLVGPMGLGIVGLCLGLITGRSVLSLACPWIVGRALAIPLRRQVTAALRPLLVTAVLFAAAFAAGQRLFAGSWLALVGGSLLTVLLATAAGAVSGLTVHQRRQLLRRVRRTVRSI